MFLLALTACGAKAQPTESAPVEAVPASSPLPPAPAVVPATGTAAAPTAGADSVMESPGAGFLQDTEGVAAMTAEFHRRLREGAGEAELAEPGAAAQPETGSTEPGSVSETETGAPEGGVYDDPAAAGEEPWAETGEFRLIPGDYAGSFRHKFQVGLWLLEEDYRPAGPDLAETALSDAALAAFFYEVVGEQLGPEDFECRERAGLLGLELDLGAVTARSMADGAGYWYREEPGLEWVLMARDSPEVAEVLRGCYPTEEFWSQFSLEDLSGGPPALVSKNGIAAFYRQLSAFGFDAVNEVPEEVQRRFGENLEQDLAAPELHIWEAVNGGWTVAFRMILTAGREDLPPELEGGGVEGPLTAVIKVYGEIAAVADPQFNLPARELPGFEPPE